jgi:chemotaxis protein CheD
MSLSVTEVKMGSLFIAQAPAELTTCGIGSCVAVCLFHVPTRWGALAHVMLPNRLDPTAPIQEDDLRYADAAITVMVHQLEQRGIVPSALTAKIVGAASMFPDIQGRSTKVGERNLEAVKQALSNEGISIVAEEVGGSVGRAVDFDLQTGIVSVRMTL